MLVRFPAVRPDVRKDSPPASRVAHRRWCSVSILVLGDSERCRVGRIVGRTSLTTKNNRTSMTQSIATWTAFAEANRCRRAGWPVRALHVCQPPAVKCTLERECPLAAGTPRWPLSTNGKRTSFRTIHTTRRSKHKSAPWYRSPTTYPRWSPDESSSEP